jgi:2-hydroxychromene-2-carboxylate isomerase
MTDSRTTVDFYFDPGCPFTWVTSRWLIEAAEQRDLTIKAHPFSLRIKHGASDNPYARVTLASLKALRVFVAIDKELGNEKAFDFYGERGYRNFPLDLQSDGPDLTEVLQAAGIDTKFAAFADDESLDKDINESMAIATQLAGEGVGSPILAIAGEDRGFFGPVLNDVPPGEKSGELWDHVSGLLHMTEFHEIKRDRTGELQAPTRS